MKKIITYPTNITRGLLVSLGLIINMLVLPCCVLMIALLKYLIPISSWQQACEHTVQVILPPIWSNINSILITYGLNIHWDIIHPNHNLSLNKWYLVISNHRSFSDILVLEKVLGGRIPKLKFFMKQSLLWQLPILGLSCHIMGYPFVKRGQSTKDLKALQKSSALFTQRPTALLSFLESTRFTEAKRDSSHSPYQHLLAPKPFSFALSLQSLAHQHPDIINITIIYPGLKNISLAKLIFGQVNHIVVRYEVLSNIPQQLITGNPKDPSCRALLRKYLSDLWQKKDQLIDHFENTTSHPVQSARHLSG